jgi:hypothetical protein
MGPIGFAMTTNGDVTLIFDPPAYPIIFFVLEGTMMAEVAAKLRHQTAGVLAKPPCASIVYQALCSPGELVGWSTTIGGPFSHPD